MKGLALEKEAIISFQQFQKIKGKDDIVYMLVDKSNNIVINLYENEKEANKALENLKDHYRFGKLCKDNIKISEIKSVLPYLI